MSDEIGPNNYLPGQHLPPVEGKMCDNHPDRPSVARMVGETDSYGSEVADYCHECLVQADEAKEQASIEPLECDFCHHIVDELFPYKDPDEGMSGPCYRICAACLDKSLKIDQNEGW